MIINLENCFKRIKNRFQLIYISCNRSRELSKGSSYSKLPNENNKPIIVALKEISRGYIHGSIPKNYKFNLKSEFGQNIKVQKLKLLEIQFQHLMSFNLIK
ncbi:DNA-directed RNA polymerase subunit omega [Candidatus Johnevansia muelleri]|uniref:DNA-directed RNA polymerase subunit omega n=1 Tax=Candidatus Johnevansia muelleri TaxID=1495769 RepID=A0A078KBJ8_9GAMM|nr:DNA-directed RNA polymerase subunit omega [Candidatus Evansia muelleri]